MAVLFFSAQAYAQNTYRAIIKDAKSLQPLQGTTVQIKNLSIGTSAGKDGSVVLTNIPSGKQVIEYSYVGYMSKTDTLIFPLADNGPVVVTLESLAGHDDLDDDHSDHEHLEEVVISATRSSRTIDNIPTRVEVISGEELDEKANMKPGDIRMLLAESTGIQTQQTSATSGNSSIRIQGLDGKYTQMIRDGFPLYSGFSGGLGLLQIAPLDLQQVEVIKGSSSTLFGGGAIAGLVNLVSKRPTKERQLNFLLNGTSALGLDASAFYAEKFEKVGATIYAAYNKGTAYDPSDIGLSAIPDFDRFTFNPKLFLYLNDATTLSAGLNTTLETRTGGDMEYLKGNGSATRAYFEENKTKRFSTQVEFQHALNKRSGLTFRNSVSYYDRSIRLPDYLFSGLQLSTYSEVNYDYHTDRSEWVAGINFLSDNFREDQNEAIALRDYDYKTLGAFVQNTWNTTEAFTLEAGLRGDYHNEYGFFLLPRVSGLWKINEHLSTRLGGGLGYKAPSVFTEDAERIQFRNVLPLDVAAAKAERSYGANYDINYSTRILDGEVGFSINQLLFYTRILNPILLEGGAGSDLVYNQPEGHFDTQGLETNLKITYKDFKLFMGYTLADVNQHTGDINRPYPLVSKHRMNNVLMYEVEDKWKIGAEAYYFSSQELNDGSRGKAYWTTGFLAEKLWERFSIFINFENLTDTRQPEFGPIYTGSITSPVFGDIYAPVDGIVVNGGIKVRL